MGRRKSNASPKSKQEIPHQRQISLAKRNEINALCEKLIRISSCCIETPTQLCDNYMKIWKVLQKIKRLEEMKTETTKRSQGIGQFMNWLKEHGADVEGASIAEFPGYDLGLRAERNYLENELILRIPRDVIFSTQSAAPELKELQHYMLIRHMPQIALAIAILIERHKENSKWKPYLDILPTTYSTALYMTPFDMAELKGSTVLEAATKQCRNIARQYAFFKQLFQNTNNAVSAILRDVFTYEQYCWAVSTAMTRQNLIPSEDCSRMMFALIPMWDMCNHENGRITTDFNITSNCSECYALRDFKKGEQIFISYGPRTSADFFIYSGFVYMDNTQDSCKLLMTINKNDPLQKERKALLEKLSLPATGEITLKSGADPISESLLAFVRVSCMREAELAHWLRSGSRRVRDLKHMDCALDTAVEENVRKDLLTRLKHLIDCYPTTLKEDLQLLETSLPQMKRLAVQLRITEKRIILNALDYVQQWIKA